jgi:hypothetical protein
MFDGAKSPEYRIMSHQIRKTELEKKTVAISFLFIVAFIEGACVMAIELAGAKMIAPFYGTSMYVWAAVLAVTVRRQTNLNF